MILNAFGEMAAGGGESFPVGRKDNSGSIGVQVDLNQPWCIQPFTELSREAM